MNLRKLGFTSRNSTKVLFLSCLALVISACAGTRAYKLPTYGVSGNVKVYGISFNRFLGVLTSYSTINGRLKSKPEDYVEIARQGSMVFLGHKEHIDAAKAVLNKPCCTDGKTSAANIAKTAQWTRGLFDLDTEVQIEILLVPDAYNYKYVTRYKIKGHQAKVRFAFRYYDERPLLTETRFAEEAASTLTHELTHVYFKLSEKPARNGISDEITASIVGVCTRTLVTQRLRIPTTGVLPEESAMQKISENVENDYENAVNQLRDGIRVNNGREEFINSLIGGILAELITQKIDKKYGHSDQLAAEKMREFCQHIVKTRHDFTMSMGLD